MDGRKSNEDKVLWVSTIFHDCEERLLRYTMRWVPKAVATEIVQDALLKLWLQDRSQIKDKVKPWLFTVCRNQALDTLKKEARLTSLDAAKENRLASTGQNPEIHFENREAAGAILKMISALPVTEQEVVILKLQEDLSYQEISDVTGHSVSYVGVLIHNGLSRLREALKKAGYVKGRERHE